MIVGIIASIILYFLFGSASVLVATDFGEDKEFSKWKLRLLFLFWPLVAIFYIGWIICMVIASIFKILF